MLTEALMNQLADTVFDCVQEQLALMRTEIDSIVEEAVRRHSLTFVGVHESGKAYSRGMVVTHDGQMWACLQDTAVRPGDSSSWQLCVRRGRDGRDVGR